MDRKARATLGFGFGAAVLPLAIGGMAQPAGAYVDNYHCLVFHHEGQPGGTRASGSAVIDSPFGGWRDAGSTTFFHWNNAPTNCEGSTGFHAVTSTVQYRWTAGGWVECDSDPGEGFNGVAMANTTCSTSGTGGNLHRTENTHKIWNQGTPKTRGPYCVTTDAHGFGC